MKKTAIAIIVLALTGCTELTAMVNQPSAMGPGALPDHGHPDGVHDDPLSPFPYSPRGW